MFVEASVPGRVNLFGNPCDIYGGLVMSSAIARRAVVRAHTGDGLRFVMGERACTVRGADDLRVRGDAFDFLRALMRALDALPDCTIEAATDIPERSGLAGSAALMVAASASLLNFLGRPASRAEILRTAYRAEVEHLNNFCGWNDFYACALGGAHAMTYREPVDGAPAVAPLAWPAGGVSFAVALTGAMHRSGKVNATLWQRWQDGDAVVRDAYATLAASGGAARRAFEARDWVAFGGLMLDNFMCQYRLEAANAVEHDLVQGAMKQGALGAKLCGAGHCGSIVVLAPDGDHARIKEGLAALGAQRYFKVAPAEGLVLGRG